MVKIRLARVGRRNDPSFRIVVQDSRKDPFGRKIEVVGFISPRSKEKKLDRARIEYWLKVGAQPSETVHNLLISEGIIKGKKINVYHPKRGAQAAAAKAVPAKPAEAAAEAPKAEAKPAETPAPAPAPTEKSVPAPEAPKAA